mgnify:FL=1
MPTETTRLLDQRKGNADEPAALPFAAELWLLTRMSIPVALSYALQNSLVRHLSERFACRS